MKNKKHPLENYMNGTALEAAILQEGLCFLGFCNVTTNNSRLVGCSKDMMIYIQRTQRGAFTLSPPQTEKDWECIIKENCGGISNFWKYWGGLTINCIS